MFRRPRVLCKSRSSPRSQKLLQGVSPRFRIRLQHKPRDRGCAGPAHLWLHLVRRGIQNSRSHSFFKSYMYFIRCSSFQIKKRKSRRMRRRRREVTQHYKPAFTLYMCSVCCAMLQYLLLYQNISDYHRISFHDKLTAYRIVFIFVMLKEKKRFLGKGRDGAQSRGWIVSGVM